MNLRSFVVVVVGALMPIIGCAAEADSKTGQDENVASQGQAVQKDPGGAQGACNAECWRRMEVCTLSACDGTKPGYSKCIEGCYETMGACHLGCRVIPF